MKKNRIFSLKVMLLILLIGICFTPIIYAGEISVSKETYAIPVGENVNGTVYSRIDTAYVFIPLSTNVEGNLNGNIGNISISVSEESGGVLGIGATRNVTLTGADGTEITGLNIAVSSSDGEHMDVFPNETGGKLIYSEDIDGNGTPGLKFELTNSKIFDGDNIYVTYTDDNGIEQRVLIGQAGDDLTFVDNSHPVANDVNEVVNNIRGAAEGVRNIVGDVIGTVASFIEEILVELFLPVGDGIVYLVSASVGEVVTTDSLIFNKVGKLNINYWDDGATDSVKNILQDVVNKWYSVFFKIAVFVYMMVLVVAGIQVLLHSTAEKTAQYKEYLVSWVIGVAILCLFPYAMKYVVMLSETAVTTVEGVLTKSEGVIVANSKPEILKAGYRSASEFFGKPEFVEQMGGNGDDPGDTMFYVRDNALESKKFILVVIYFILIGQMLVILLMYYKRAFMIAFLITIFPLVAMTYAIDKMGDKKAQSFSIWFREFIVNVIVQLFHAVVYVVVVSGSVKLFVDSNGQKWLFMLISVLFLFQGEKILRSIFSVESKANTIGDLAATAVTYTAMTKFLNGGGDKGKIGSKQDNADMDAMKERNNARNSWRTGAVSTVSAINADGDTVSSPSPSTQGSDDAGQYRGNDPKGVDTNGFDASAALDNVTQKSMKHRVKNGLASRAAKMGANAVGGVIGATYGMSKGDAGGNMASNMLQGSHFGTQIAKGVTTPISGAINMVERRVDGAKLASKIKDGEMDHALNLDAMTGAIPPNINPDEVANRYGEDIQKIYREAIAAAAKAGAKGGRAKAEAAYWNYMKNNTKK